jgi:hypothetical protein
MKNILKTHGIESVVLREYLKTGMGEIPPNEAWVELWILDEWRSKEAQEIIEEAQEDADTEQEAWLCPKCGEELEGQFDRCWKCGAVRR